jgi:glycosyltransferase involved in cell wall biosynthesis
MNTVAESKHRPEASDRTANLPVVLDTRVVTGSGGGPDKTILNSPRYLTPLGYRMLCGYLYPPNDSGYSDIVRKAERYSAPLVSIPDRGATDWRVVQELVRLCRRENVRIWHGHDYKTNLLGLLIRKFHPMRLVTTAHGWVHHTARTPVYYRIDRWCLPRYERVFCVSDDLLDECLKAGVPSGNCVLLENGIDTEDYRRSRSVGEAKARLGFPAAGTLIGAVGRLEPEKAFDALILSVADLRDAGEDVGLVIVGEGSDRTRLTELARDRNLADRVILAGWQSDVRSYYEAMDVFALSSLREGLPNVLLEAMALKVPCVATRINGVPRVIQHGANGLLVTPADRGELTTALRRLVRSPSLREELIAAGRRTVETRYSFAERMRRLASAYDQLIDHGRP